MLQKFGKKVMNNFGLKILALMFSIVFWIVVVNLDDPNQTKSYTTSVSLENKSYITSMGKWADYLDGKNTVTFSVNAKRSIHQNLSNSNFTASADAQKIEYNEQSGTYRVPVTVTCNRNSSSVTIVTKELYLNMELEDSASKQFPIKAATTGMVVDGCALGDVEITDANVMKVSGPASVVNKIDTVMATINVDGMANDITDRVTPVFYDAEGNVVDTVKLTQSVSTVNISAQILNTKDVELEFLTEGVPAEGFEQAALTYSPKTVRIKGEAAVLNKINKITVPQEVLDLTGVSSNIEKTVDISTYLPTGTALVISSDAKIDVTVEIEAVRTKILQVPVENIQIIGLSSNERAAFDSDVVVLSVTGRISVLDEIDEKEVYGSIDVTDLSVGENSVLVAFELDTNTISFNDTYAVLVIKDITQEEDTESDSGRQSD